MRSVFTVIEPSCAQGDVGEWSAKGWAKGLSVLILSIIGQ